MSFNLEQENINYLDKQVSQNKDRLRNRSHFLDNIITEHRLKMNKRRK